MSAMTASVNDNWTFWDEIKLEKEERTVFDDLVKQLPNDYADRSIISPILCGIFDSEEHRGYMQKTDPSYYIESIELPASEQKEYLELVKKSTRGVATVEERRVLFAEVLESEAYSFDLKRKFVFHRPSVTEARKWGCQNLEGDDLREFMELLFTLPAYMVLEGDILIGVLIEKNHMNLDIASRIVSQWIEKQELMGGLLITGGPLFDWARKEYDMGEEIPDSWVRKFLSHDDSAL